MRRARKPEQNNKPDRREFFRQSLTAGMAAPLAMGGVAGRGPESANRGSGASETRTGEFPRIFQGKQLQMIAFPLGGIGTGSISIGGRGQLRDWEIFNRPAKGRSPEYCFAAIRWQAQGEEAAARILEAKSAPPYHLGPSGMGSGNLPGLPRLEAASFAGEFPFSRISFVDEGIPLRVTLEAFSPFIPLDIEASSLPAVILRYRITNRSSKPCQVAVAMAIESPVGGRGRRNDYRDTGSIRGIYMDNPDLSDSDPLKGSFALATNAKAEEVSGLTGWKGYGFWVAPLTFWQDFQSDGRLDPQLHPEPNSTGSLAISKSLSPGAETEFLFVLGWHFHNRTPKSCGWTAPEGLEETIIGNAYSKRFPDAWAAVSHLLGNLGVMERESRNFVEAVKQTDLPAPVLDAAIANLSTLCTTTVFQTEDGRFHAFEGSSNDRGCCSGSCTHVLNYEATLPFLFPSLSRSLRESHFDFGTDDEGRMDFRYLLPYGVDRFGLAAADGQMGTIVKFYQDWKLSGDEEWLRRWWPKVKKALAFAWVQGGWDADKDGVMEGTQHTTFDVEFYGPNPLCEFWYLAALRAAEEMAGALGDGKTERECRELFLRGSRWVDENLFNGEYYVQEIRPRASSEIAAGLIIGAGARDPRDPEFQMGHGCLADQLVGQYAAHLAGLGYLGRPDNIRRALASVYRYNFKKTLETHENYARTYALNDESGVVVAEFPGVAPERVRVTSAPEIWSGSEYQVAAHMLYEGLTEQGLEIIQAIRSRHDGERRNPWNEPECGNHYIRALAAWSSVVVLSGFGYDARLAEVQLTPRQPMRTGFWSVASGWGNFVMDPGRLQIMPKWGSLQVESLRVRRSDWLSSNLPFSGIGSGTAQLGGQPSPLRHNADQEWVYFRFPARLSVTREKPLRIDSGQ